jgi:pyridoxine 5-phosphate synthase
VVKHSKKIKEVVQKLQDKGIIVSLFIEPEEKQVEESAVIQARFIELHTGSYANARDEQKIKLEYERLGTATQQARLIGLRINAGHGLDYLNVSDIVKIPGIEELNIGFSVIARSVFVGMKKATEEMKRALGGKK